MTLLEFIIFFMLLTLVSSFFIVSFYELTRHYIVIQPDGTEKRGGLFLSSWSWYFEYVLKVNKLYYSGEPLQYKITELKRLLPPIAAKFLFPTGEENSFVADAETITEEDKVKIEAVLMCKLSETKHGDKSFWFLYLEEPLYLFPAIIRKPLSACVRCMSSFFGLSIWCSLNYLYNPFSWTNHKIFAFILFMFIFVVSISKLNDFVYKKTYV